MLVSEKPRDRGGDDVPEPVEWSLLADLERFSCSEDHGRGTESSGEMPEESLGSAVYQVPDHSQSTASFSPDGSPGLRRDSRSREIELKVKELETAMLGPSLLEVHDAGVSVGLGCFHPAGNWEDLTAMLSRGDLKEILCACAKAIEGGDFPRLDLLMSQLGTMVSVSGEPFQRLAAYIFEGIQARLADTGSFIYKALRCKEPASRDLMSYMQILFEVCPYFKFGYMSANGAIAEATKSERKIHIIDFMIAQGSQW
ncbi:hypothetical protein MLD38_012755 [Melastoma candidum]|uniref:Uncharacterized protein n=1 Tax=Melastoma candidum TaxID=119954 RepID=A0ACB9R7F6_9MYRT|nr:hypothetical protein MLD38_012755 [Melastoma candidum]